jgi:peptidoglycan-associated lipoprotein
MKRQSLFLYSLISAAALVSGCATARVVKPSAVSATTPAAPSPTDAARSTGDEPDVRELTTQEIPELKAVHFPYDSDRLDEAALATLQANADYLKAHPELKIQVAGNCDQRGTVAYNLALGQRRAAAVRSYYKGLGIEPERVATISYGKERLLCSEATDDCWGRNRRASTLEVLSPNVAGQPVLRTP